MNRKLITYLRLLGLVSLFSYVIAIIFSPLAYPNYKWISQAVIFSIISLIFIIIEGFYDKQYISLSKWTLCLLMFMLIDAIDVGIVPSKYFGIPERFSILSTTFFNKVLSIYLFKNFNISSFPVVIMEY